ncbi:MAG: ABC transporter permease [Chloroflexi bacterium]|nr:ABC transporter permease [Chloroflexota bacterium]
MITFLVRRTLLAGLTTFVISIVAFLAIQLPPGDYATTYVQRLLGDSNFAHSAGGVLGDPAIEQQIREDFGLDQPLVVQYSKWALRVVQLDFGNSMEHNVKITEVIGQRLVNTLLLALGTILFTWVLAIPIGIYSAVKHNTAGDYAVTFVGFLGLAVPDFLLALALMWIGFVWFDLSIGGLYSPEYLEASWSFGRFVDLLKHLWIPALVLGTAGTAGLIRILRNNLLDELAKPYVVAARARGMSEWKLVLKYPVRMALNPFISTIGYLLPFLLSGSVVVSVVLSLPTLGPVLLKALLSEDLFLAATIVLMLGVLTVIGTLISDILLVLFDPRIRFES